MEEKEYFEDWPKKYYALNEGWKKQKVLTKHIEEFHLKEDEDRLEAFKKRYRISKDGYIDVWMQAFLSLRNLRDTKVSFFNKNSMLKDIDIALTNLSLYEEETPALKEEREHFLQDYIDASTKSFSRAAILGMGKRTDDKVQQVVQENINTILKDVPGRFSLDDKCLPLYEIAQEILNKQES